MSSLGVSATPAPPSQNYKMTLQVDSSPQRPSWLQRLLAQWVLYYFIPILGAIYAEWLAITHSQITSMIMTDWRYVAWLVAFILTSGPFGFLLGIFVAYLPNQFFYHLAIRLNRGPFKAGDCVQIISGKFAGTVTTVTEGWQGNSVRVDLGADAKKNFKDIFQPPELMRADTGSGR